MTRMHNLKQGGVLMYNEVQAIQGLGGEPGWTAAFDGEHSKIKRVQVPPQRLTNIFFFVVALPSAPTNFMRFTGGGQTKSQARNVAARRVLQGLRIPLN